MTLERKRKPDRRAQMVQAAAEIIQSKGLRATSTRDVTGALGVGTGLLNHYFRWPELRALAWTAIFEEVSSFLFSANATPPEALEFYFTGAFAPDAAPYWSLWLEALELAREDEDLHVALKAMEQKMTGSMRAILASGNARGDWILENPDATATRLQALYDGLAGQLMARMGLTEADATAHLRKAFRLEVG